MERALAFAALLVCTVLYALVRGGTPERLAALAYLMTYLAGVALTVQRSDAFQSVELGVLVTDAALAAVLVTIAVRANRYWTIWAASLQTVALTGHLAKFVIPEILAPAYAITLIAWSYAAIPVLALATLRHQQRVSTFGRDPDWSLD